MEIRAVTNKIYKGTTWAPNKVRSWIGKKYYGLIKGGNPNLPYGIGLGDGPKDLPAATVQLTRWEEGGVEVAADHFPHMELHPTYNFSRIGWAARQAYMWYPHALTDVPLYVLPFVFWGTTLMSKAFGINIDFLPLITPAAYMFLYGAGFFSSLSIYALSHKQMGDTFSGDLISKECLLATCGPGWVEGSAKAISRVGSGFTVTKTGGPKESLPWRIATGLTWRLGGSILATAGGIYMFYQGAHVENLHLWDQVMTYFGWGTNTVFAFLNALKIAYGIHSHDGYWEKGKWKSGLKYFANDLLRPADPEGIAMMKILTLPFRPFSWLYQFMHSKISSLSKYFKS